MGFCEKHGIEKRVSKTSGKEYCVECYKERHKDDNQQGGGYKKGGNEGFALSYAKDLMIKKLDKVDYDAQKLVDSTIWIADKFYNWLEGKGVKQ